jgi:hypothetical protein
MQMDMQIPDLTVYRLDEAINILKKKEKYTF